MEEVVAVVMEGMLELCIGKEGTLEDWIEKVLEVMVGEVEGAEGIVMSCTVTVNAH